MGAESKTTTEHEEIKRWVEERGGGPAIVKTAPGGESGLLRVDFPGSGAGAFEHISWEEFFRIFEGNKLAFLYQEETKEGGVSRFFKFVRREGGK